MDKIGDQPDRAQTDQDSVPEGVDKPRQKIRLKSIEELDPIQPVFGPMGRGAQTAWIVGTMLVIAFIALGLYLGQDDPRYPGCTGFMGVQDTDCRAEHAVRRLMSGGY